MSFATTLDDLQNALFADDDLPKIDRKGRRNRMLPLGALIGTAQVKYQLADKAPWPVWSGSTRKPVSFRPMPRRQAVKAWHDARRFERQTRQPGCQDGALGRNGLAVLHALLFDFLNHTTGELTPARATIANRANISVRSVSRGLDKLKAAGVLNWIRRCVEDMEEGVYRLRQQSSAYFVLAQTQWRGFWSPPPAPPPYPEAWGAAPPLPDPLTLASIAKAEGASWKAQLAALECDPRDGVANALARYFRHVEARNP